MIDYKNLYPSQGMGCQLLAPEGGTCREVERWNASVWTFLYPS